MSGSERRGSRDAVRLMPGDVISRPKGVVDHVGIVLDGGRVLHNVPGQGEHVTSLEAFSAGRPVSVDRRSESERLRTWASAQRAAGGRYHVLLNNCEHTVYRAREGRPRSPQLLEYSLGAVGAVAGGVLLRHWGAAVAGFEFGRRLGSRLGRRRR